MFSSELYVLNCGQYLWGNNVLDFMDMLSTGKFNTTLWDMAFISWTNRSERGEASVILWWGNAQALIEFFLES